MPVLALDDEEVGTYFQWLLFVAYLATVCAKANTDTATMPRSGS